MALTYEEQRRRQAMLATQNQQGAQSPQAAQSQPEQQTRQTAQPASITSQAAQQGSQTAQTNQVQQTVQSPAMSTQALAGQQPGPYQYNNQAQLEALYQQVISPTPFTFDLRGNPMYQQYKDQYINLGQIAMQDAMGQAAGLTGGYGNSYGQRVGQQTYNGYLQRLNDVVPELYAQERSMYDADRARELQLYQLEQQRADADYGRYMDDYNRWLTQYQMAQEQENWQANMDFQREQFAWQQAKAAAASGGSGGRSSGSGSGSNSGSGSAVTSKNYDGAFTDKDGVTSYNAAVDNLKEVIAAYVYSADYGGKKNVGSFEDWLRVNGITGQDVTLAMDLYGKYLRGEIK